MLNYIFRRILLMIPTFIGITLMLFLIVRFAPGLTGGGAFGEGGMRDTQESRLEAEKSMLRKLGMLDKNDNKISPPIQYIRWLWRAVRLEFGDSIRYNMPVSKLIIERVWITATINFLSILVVYLLAIPGGLLAAVKRGKWFDQSWGFFTIALFSLPVIWIGSLSIALLANPRQFNWFPSGGIHSIDTTGMSNFAYAMDFAWHLILPVAVMSLGSFAYLSKLMRASLLDNLHMEYARTARAKGVSQFRVVMHHVFRNSLLPLITVVAGIVPGLIGGSVVIEKIFSIPGMGQLAFNAVLARDLPVLQAVTFIGTVLTLFFLLLRDLCYALIDPRVSYD
ncbi:MAG: ABC transporter permease [Phycisphaerales bacterium]|nr:ABC transporter permease [Phycisphaerales bacterium]